MVLGSVDESKIQGKNAGFEVRDVYSATGEDEVCRGFWGHLPEYLAAGAFKPLRYVVKTGLSAESVNEVLDAYRHG